MNVGRVAIVMLLVAALLAGAGVYYTNNYAFYGDVVEGGEVRLTTNAGGQQAILAEDVREIDRDTSELAYRACFTTTMSEAMLTETYVVYDTPAPTVAPDWFDCFDATEIGQALDAERAFAFLGQANIVYGFDRVVAIDDQGRGFVWHQINPCGDAHFKGDPLPPGCPEAPDETDDNG